MVEQEIHKKEASKVQSNGAWRRLRRGAGLLCGIPLGGFIGGAVVLGIEEIGLMGAIGPSGGFVVLVMMLVGAAIGAVAGGWTGVILMGRWYEKHRSKGSPGRAIFGFIAGGFLGALAGALLWLPAETIESWMPDPLDNLFDAIADAGLAWLMVGLGLFGAVKGSKWGYARKGNTLP